MKKKLVTALVIAAPNWGQEFELMCDASDYTIGAVLGQKWNGRFHVIHYASKVLNGAQINYATMEKEILAVLYAVKKVSIISCRFKDYCAHRPFSYIISTHQSGFQAKLIRWVLLLQEFDLDIRDKKGCDNLVSHHQSKLVNE